MYPRSSKRSFMNLMAGQWKTPWSAQSLCKFIETGAFRRRLSVLSESHCELPHHANASACCWRGLLPCWVWADARWSSMWGAATAAMPLGYQLDGRTLLKLIWHHILKPLEPWTSDKGCTCQQIPAVILLLWKMPFHHKSVGPDGCKGTDGVFPLPCVRGARDGGVGESQGAPGWAGSLGSAGSWCTSPPQNLHVAKYRALFCWCQGWEVKEGVAEL